MDATPVTLGQEFGGYAAQLDDGIARLRDTLPRLCVLPLGGTAVGTGINAPKAFARKVVVRLAQRTGLPLSEAKDHFAAQGARDALVETSGQLRTLAVSLVKIANDLRWMGSGPRTGLGEIRLPDLQPGSSIMPGKVNPVIPEVVTQVGAQVMGNDVTIGFAGAQGNFELNVFVPVIARDLLESIGLLTNVCTVFADEVHRRHRGQHRRGSKEYAESSPSIGTALTPYIGYEAAAEIVKESARTGKSIREIVRAAQADDRRRARPRARRRGDDPRRHHRVRSLSRVDHGSRRAIIAAFLANLGIALSKFAAFVAHGRGVDARGGDPLARRHRQPGPADARRQAVAAARRRSAPVRLRHAALLLGVRGRARAVQRRRVVRDLRGHREAAAPARARRPADRDRGARREHGPRVVLAAHRDAREPGRAARASRSTSSCGARRSPSWPWWCSRTSAP